MSMRSQIESLNLKYSQIRDYLKNIHGIEHPGKGMTQLIDTIVGLDDVKSAVKALRRLQELQNVSDGLQMKNKKTKGVKRKSKFTEEDEQLQKGDEADNEADHPIMLKLKEELVIRGKTTTSNSWPILVGRLLKALEEEE